LASGAEPNAAPAAEPAPTLSKPPKLIHFVEATPPPSLAERGGEVDVILSIDIDETGKVVSVEVAQSGGAEFDAAALAAARQFQFEPGESEGHPVPVRITYRYRFVNKPAAPPAGPAAPGAPTGPTVPVSGKVLRKGDRSPLAGVSVIVDETDKSAVTDEQGLFAFPALPVGAHTLHLRSPTTAPAEVPIDLRQGKGVQLTTYVEVKAKEKYTSVVRGKRALVETVEYTLQGEEIRHMPGTQGDTLKAVQNLPGVARAPFGIGSLPVWGSAPEDTRVYVDGVPIPLLYHFGGLRSTVNSEIISSLTFTPGGYQVFHGLGLGGVVDLETRKPRTDGYHGFAQIDLIDGSLMIEGPITKNLAFLVAGRRSWIDATLHFFTSNSVTLTPVYYDYQARLTWKPTPRDDLDIILLGSDDQLKVVAKIKDAALAAAFDSHIYDHKAILSWWRRLQNGATFGLVSSLGPGVPFQLGAQYGNTPTTLDTTTLNYTARAIIRKPIEPRVSLDGGIDFEGGRSVIKRAGSPTVTMDPFSGTNAGGFSTSGGFSGGTAGFATDELILYTNHFAPYLAATVTLLDKRLTLIPQYRFQVMTFTGYQGTPDAFSTVFISQEPRLIVRYQLTQREVLKASAGVYAQPPPLASLSRVFGDPFLGPEHGAQYVVGSETDVTSTLHVEVDAFWKSLSDLVVPATVPGVPLVSNDGEGRAYGIELLVRQQLWKNLYGWISYTLSRSQRRDQPDQAFHPFAFDQPHILNVLASYLLPRNWQVGFRFRYTSGNPLTPVVGSFYDSNGDRYIPIAGVPFSARLPAFMQLDLRVDKAFTFNRWKLSLYLDVQNATRRSNAEAQIYNFNFTVVEPVNGLPLLPILGIRGEF
jgi:TonB family protein